MKIRLLTLFVLIVSISSCVKERSYPIVPNIEFKSVSSNFVKSGSIDTITFSFTDGDGDIGVDNSVDDTSDICGLQTGDSASLRARAFNVFLIDSRDLCVVQLASAFVTAEGKFKSLAGEILAISRINSKKCFAVPSPGCPKDTVVYTILFRDLAGNFSNAVQTVPIVVDGE
ncbi:MAG: hypothetical protein V4615_11655 [Bacteroidota bacterium]